MPWYWEALLFAGVSGIVALIWAVIILVAYEFLG